MSKAVLISINPKWCELIANGDKTIEVRKTKPKLETPFKCYIYCTNSGRPLVLGDVFRGDWETKYVQTYGYSREEAEKIWEVYNGKVMGEFVCDRIITVDCDSINLFDRETCEYIHTETCLSREDLWEYTNGLCALGWHITNLIIYDKPKRLQRLYGYCGMFPQCESCGDKCPVRCRPPQSWCYVEDLL